jgi:DNA polymerase III epsilon subunit-like protein
MELKVTFFDFETTSQFPVSAEILTGYFRTLSIKGNEYGFVDDLFITSKPEKFISESTRIHGITEDEADNFSEPKQSLREICRYIEKHSDSTFCCHSNATLFGKYGHFDWTVLKTAMAYQSQDAYFWFENKFRNIKVISTHTIAKKVLQQQKNDLGTLAEQFNFKYKKHDCREDVFAMIEIFRRLTDGLGIHTTYDLYDIGHYSGGRNWMVHGFDTSGLLI